MSFGKATPILRIFDEVKAKKFYVDFLGFEVDWEHRFEEGLPLYMQISKNGCVLHLSEHHRTSAKTSGASCTSSRMTGGRTPSRKPCGSDRSRAATVGSSSR
jgi:uncharacterized glyoxalase superfamily protein PhnB